jgi:hypothetical protein
MPSGGLVWHKAAGLLICAVPGTRVVSVREIVGVLACPLLWFVDIPIVDILAGVVASVLEAALPWRVLCQRKVHPHTQYKDHQRDCCGCFSNQSDIIFIRKYLFIYDRFWAKTPNIFLIFHDVYGFLDINCS